MTQTKELVDARLKIATLKKKLREATYNHHGGNNKPRLSLLSPLYAMAAKAARPCGRSTVTATPTALDATTPVWIVELEIRMPTTRRRSPAQIRWVVARTTNVGIPTS